MEDALLSAESYGAVAQGYAAEGAYDGSGHYQGGHVRAGYKLAPSWSLEADYWRRHPTDARDSADIGSWLAGVSYSVLASPDVGRKLTLRLSAWGNYASSLGKSSAAGSHFSDFQSDHPRDTQAQADLVYTGQPSTSQWLTGFASAGYSWVRSGDIEGTLQQGGCPYNFRVAHDSTAIGKLTAAPCRTAGAIIPMGGFPILATQPGIDADRGYNYSGAFLGAGGSWQWRYGPVSVVAGYHAQYFFRDLDTRLGAYGAPRPQFNQAVLLQLSYAVNRYVDVFARGQGFQNSLTGYAPMLYNPATANRLDRSYGLLSIGLRVSGF